MGNNEFRSSPDTGDSWRYMAARMILMWVRAAVIVVLAVGIGAVVLGVLAVGLGITGILVYARIGDRQETVQQRH